MHTIHLELYFDESGRFTETDPEAGDRQRFASQLAGLLAPAGAMTEAACEELVRDANDAAGSPLSEGFTEFHATEIRDNQAYRRLVGEVLSALERKGWQPVRLANHEGVHFGDRIGTYTNMVAWLLTRLAETRLAEEQGAARLGIDVIAASLVDEGELVRKDEYLPRINEYRAFSAVRDGRTKALESWKIDGFRFGSGKRNPVLWICDLLSNASKDDFGRLDTDGRDRLRGLLGDYDFSLSLGTRFDQVAQLLELGSLTTALILLAEESRAATRLVGEPARWLDRVLARLRDMGGPARAYHLTATLAWLDQAVEVRRDAVLGEALARWFLDHVEAPLRARLDEGARETLDAFRYGLHRRALTSCNHLGALSRARAETNALRELYPRLSGRWEVAPELTEGLLAEAVHRTDCHEFERASALAKQVADYYEGLTGLLHDIDPDLAPERVRSELRGKALGTWLQSEIYAAQGNRQALAAAREISDQALAEFSAPLDLARQQQYRCMLETFADAPSEARRRLQLGIGAPGDSYEDLARFIEDLDTGPQGFALLHWLRLGAHLFLEGSTPERKAYDAALGPRLLKTNPWLKEPGMSYPAHGIRRYGAVIAAARGDASLALSILGHLRELDALGQGHVLLAVLELAGTLEVAGTLWESSRKQARAILERKDRDRPGALSLARDVLQALAGLEVPVRARIEAWTETVTQILSNAPSDAGVRLVGLGREVRW